MFALVTYFAVLLKNIRTTEYRIKAAQEFHWLARDYTAGNEKFVTYDAPNSFFAL
ncbi:MULTISPECIES: hypothetical protein [unclassified Nostoc]|uniref:hypothetical protein n=1 Tax=unclassified Nostoc TaxID=2593658 RepID=UPI002AD23DCC|nr:MULTISPECIES: hypothetical protein [unclassified Nostoc]MDZ8121004.1 hypothetical protein [Nostoc sp. CmiVER01]MDZ8223728.1 hypothetical protein [Nostoc sp. ChiVER01]